MLGGAAPPPEGRFRPRGITAAPGLQPAMAISNSPQIVALLCGIGLYCGVQGSHTMYVIPCAAGVPMYSVLQ